MAHPQKSSLINVALMLLSFVGCFILGEIAIRVAFPGWPYFFAQGMLRADPELGTLLGKPLNHGRLVSLYGEYNVAIETDGDGFRLPAELKAGQPGIILLGDSFAFGWGVAAEQTLAAVAAKIRGTGMKNFGVPGTDISDYIRIARWKRDELAGRDVVALITIENDLLSYNESSVGGPRAFPTQNKIMKLMIENSAFINLVLTVVKEHPFFVKIAWRLGVFTSSGMQDMDGNAFEASASLLGRMRDVSGSARSFTVVLVPPRPAFAKDYSPFVEALRRQGIFVIDPGVAEGDNFRRDGHWTPAGHERVGKLLAQHLMAVADQTTRSK